jgi:predicted phage gp36 major capsid-like protein
VEQLESTVENELIEGPIACNLFSIKSRSYLMLGNFERAYEIGIKGVEQIREQYGAKGRQLVVGYFRLGWIC